jgi:hypothetical protein
MVSRGIEGESHSRRAERAALAGALAAVDQTGERTYEAELHRLQGELRLDRSHRTGRKRQVATGAAATNSAACPISTSSAT